MDHRLRQDPRVAVMERVNARHPFPLPEIVDLAVVDVSFISLRLVLPEISRHLGPWRPVLALIKPQFEAERGEVGRGGVVRDARVHARVLGRFLLWAIANGYRIRGLTPSPIVGDAGNREFFVLLVPPPGDSPPSP
jgi:23S rRNA (cytidine1920-2'-O)/16S rRNA (cytidine1409-2'-O)-methyltransferase